MKMPKKIALGIAVITLLSGCAISINPTGSSSAKPSESGSSSLDSSTYDGPTKTFKLYCANDFHGAVKPNGYEVGLDDYFTFLKEEKDKDPEHTLVFSAGDMWQGSLESNASYGNYVTEAMNAVPFDAMAYGNHEFDYGAARIADNRAKADFPFLGANIMNYENGVTTNTIWSQASPSTVIVKDGVKIGVVGAIGEDLTNSITSKNVQNLSFPHPETYCIKEAERLKAEGCDIMVLLLHEDADSIRGGGEYSAWKNAANLKDYFDVAFCAHSHKKNDYDLGGVPLLQGYCNGRAYSYVELEVKGKEVTYKRKSVDYASAVGKQAPALKELADQYLGAEFQAKANAVAGTLNGELTYKTVSAFSTVAIYEKYVKQYPTLCCAMNNSQRASVTSGPVTYSELYKAMPFTNSIVIADVKGSELTNEARYNNTYTGDVATYGTLNPNQYYRIAVIDYLFYHQGSRRTYDYFPGLQNGSTTVVAEYETYPVDCAFEYAVNDLGGVINAADYQNGAPGINLYA